MNREPGNLPVREVLLAFGRKEGTVLAENPIFL
jgi:hypothetical protein